MKNNNISPNALRAFQNFKEEIASDMGIDLNNRVDKLSRKKVESIEDSYTNLGRS